MTRARYLLLTLSILAVAFTAAAQTPVPTQPTPFAPAPAPSLQPPLPPLPESPVAYFRRLLALSPAERMRSLTNRPPEVRARILAKVHEYLAMDPNDRELRLRATELRWYLTPLFRLAPADRAARLDQVPSELRDLITSRLAEWDALPASAQQEMLVDAKTLPYFARVETNNAPLDAAHQKIADQFNQFFVLTAGEQAQCLASLSDAERAQMEKTLQTFHDLPPQQRLTCIRNYARFTGMSPAERADFLKNAEHWSQMSPKERQAWRDLVAEVPLMPPRPLVPLNLIPPHPPLKPARPNMATNVN